MIDLVKVVPVTDEGLGNSAYVVDLGDGGALVVDPERIVGPYREVAADRGLRIRHVVETHLHADFVSGARELATEGAELLLPAEGGYAFGHRGLHAGDEVDLGGLTLRAIATPGHTPEHLAHLLLEGDVPVALFSGGTLMAGGVARPDLISPDQTLPLARAAWRSITEQLLSLPDDLPVYPTHGGGSFCSAGGDGQSVTTIGQERAANPLLQAEDEDDFVARLLGGLGSFPPYFLRLRDVNRAGAPVLGTSLPRLAPLTPDAVAEASARGAHVVDARPIARFAAGHVPGAVSIELRGQFATWLGWVLPFDAPLVVVLDDDQDEADLVGQALTIGWSQLVGRMAGGMAAWEAAGRELATIPLYDQPPGDRPLLDIRQASERDDVRVPGARHVELGEVAAHVDELPADVVTHCGHGQRAMTAASLLRRNGLRDVAATSATPERLAEAAGPRR